MDGGIGYRFHPSELELIDHYLRQKMLGNDGAVWQIPEVNVLNFEPWELPQQSIVFNDSNDQVWYFFSTPNYKYSNSKRVDRTTNGGYWKITGKDRKIMDIGVQKTLVFYRGRPKGVKTHWVMHEYSATFDFPTKRDFVICKIKRKLDADADGEDVPNFEEGESSTAISANTENQSYNNYNSNFHEEGYTPTTGYSSENYATEPFTEDVQAYMQPFQSYDQNDYNLNSAFQWPNNHYY